MARLSNDVEDIRQKLEFCLTNDANEKQKSVMSNSAFTSKHNWNSSAGLALIILLGVPLVYCSGYYFGMPDMNTKDTPNSIALLASLTPNHTAERQPDLRFVPDVPRDDADTPVTSMVQHMMMSASRSAITGIVDHRTMTASYYWTLVLRNDGRSAQEAQMEIKLPAGAVVSRATLWVNGRPQEAAFDAVERAQQAYSWVANARRDPLLITQVAPDRVLIKASPVQHGHDLKLRVGMTVPMQLNSRGEAFVTMPKVLASNFALVCRQDIHLTASSPLYANLPGMDASAGDSSLLRGNIKAADLRNLTVTVPGQSNFRQIATRATHANPPAFIVATLNTQTGADFGKVSYTKTFTAPDCTIINSDDAAFRISYLWAHQEIEKLASTNRADAVELAAIYREVSSVSGAVVLELQSDYSFNGLDRNMYRSTAYAQSGRMSGAPSAGPVNMELVRRSGHNPADFANKAVDKPTRAAGMDAAQPVASSADMSNEPMLLGATNGTLAPQSSSATKMVGDELSVRDTTKGNVEPSTHKDADGLGPNRERLSARGNLEGVICVVANVVRAFSLMFGAVLLISNLLAVFGKSDKSVKRRRRIAFGAFLLAGGFALPWLTNNIIAFLRDYYILN